MAAPPQSRGANLTRAASAGAALLLFALFVLLPAFIVQGNWRAAAHPPAVPALVRAKGQLLQSPSAASGWVDRVALVEHVQRITAPNEPIFSGVADTSRLFINDSMLYFLTARRSGTRWIEMEPGQTNSQLGQRALIDELRRNRVRVLVLWDVRSLEANATSRSNGVTDFDEFVRASFKLDRRFGSYAVMIACAS